MSIISNRTNSLRPLSSLCVAVGDLLFPLCVCRSTTVELIKTRLLFYWFWNFTFNFTLRLVLNPIAPPPLQQHFEDSVSVLFFENFEFANFENNQIFEFRKRKAKQKTFAQMFLFVQISGLFVEQVKKW